MYISTDKARHAGEKLWGLGEGRELEYHDSRQLRVYLR